MRRAPSGNMEKLGNRIYSVGGQVNAYVVDGDQGVVLIVGRGWFNASPGPEIDAGIRHLAEPEFEVPAFGHSRPIRSGAASAFRKFGGEAVGE